MTEYKAINNWITITKYNEKITSKELNDLLEIVSEAQTADTYWLELLMNSLRFPLAHLS